MNQPLSPVLGTKYEQLMFLVALMAAPRGEVPRVWDALNHTGPGSSLRASVDLHQDTVGNMAQEAINYVINDGPRPEWLRLVPEAQPENTTPE